MVRDLYRWPAISIFIDSINKAIAAWHPVNHFRVFVIDRSIVLRVLVAWIHVLLWFTKAHKKFTNDHAKSGKQEDANNRNSKPFTPTRCNIHFLYLGVHIRFVDSRKQPKHA